MLQNFDTFFNDVIVRKVLKAVIVSFITRLPSTLLLNADEHLVTGSLRTMKYCFVISSVLIRKHPFEPISVVTTLLDKKPVIWAATLCTLRSSKFNGTVLTNSYLTGTYRIVWGNWQIK